MSSKRKHDSSAPVASTASAPSKRSRRPLSRIIFVTGNAKKLQEVQAILFSHDSTSKVLLTNRKLDLDEPQFAEPEEICEWKVLRAAEALLKQPDLLKPRPEEIERLRELQGDAAPSNGSIEDAFDVENMPTYVLTEDTCLCFDSLDGYPGPYIKWFLDKIGLEGLNTIIDGFSFQAVANGKTAEKSRRGNALCTFAMARIGGSEAADGATDGPKLLSKNMDETTVVTLTKKGVHLFAGKTFGTIVRPRGPKDFGWDPIFQPEGFDKTYAELEKVEKNKISHRFRALEGLKEWLRKNT